MQVLKFGGTSVANAKNIQCVIDIVNHKLAQDRTVVVVSALGGITDVLLQCANLAANGDEGFKDKLQEVEVRHLEVVRQLIPVTHQSSMLSMVKKSCNELEDICNGILLLGELSARIKDRIVSYGELLSSQIIAAAFNAKGIVCVWKDAREIITTDSQFNNAVVDFKSTNTLTQQYFKSTDAALSLMPGFVASDVAGTTTTLGRGGSDYTAAIIGAATDATAVEIWTDVSGMMTADPRLVPNAIIIPQISYQEAMELSHFGAKVIYPPTIQPLLVKKIPVWIKNTFAPDDYGTVIQADTGKDENVIRGISSINKLALLSLEGSGMVGIPGFSKRLFEALANAKINVILITQGSSEHSICVGVDESLATVAKQAVDQAFAYEIQTGKVDPLVVETDLAIVALVGDNMKSHPGISGRMFGTLGRNGVNVRAIAQGSSERNISAVIAAKDVKKSINVLHEQFFETTYKQVNLFICGVGNVGSRLLDQLQQQIGYLQTQLHLQVNVVALANSKKVLWNENGIHLSTWKKDLAANGSDLSLKDLIEKIGTTNLRNSVFVDVTANADVARHYDQLLKHSIAVVACNKIAASAEYSYYKKLKELAREFNTQFLFETNVGAGLPIIGTLNDLLRSGDKVNKIEAVLSGTLNFVFNNYNGEQSFASVVRQAQVEGYTEPDPRLDLGGTDVMRKIMILARESGHQLEMDDIANRSFMPASCMEGDVANFYQQMEIEEAHFKQIYEAAVAESCKLKFVAKFEDGKASVGLQHIDAKNNLYHLYGKDNVVLFYTNRYVDQPLVIKGAGAGAEVTASGVFADIIRAAKI